MVRKIKRQPYNRSTSLIPPNHSPLVPTSRLRGRVVEGAVMPWDTDKAIEHVQRRHVQLCLGQITYLLYESKISAVAQRAGLGDAVVFSVCLTWDVVHQEPEVTGQFFSIRPLEPGTLTPVELIGPLMVDCCEMFERDLQLFRRRRIREPPPVPPLALAS